MMIKCRMTERSKEFPKTVQFMSLPIGASLCVVLLLHVRRKNENIRHETVETSERGHPKTGWVYGSDGTADRQAGER